MEKVRVGITHGDINGIGYELILKTFSEPEMFNLCTPIIYGSSKILAYYKQSTKLQSVNYNIIERASYAKPKILNIVNVITSGIKAEPGVISRESGISALTALERAIDDLNRNYIDVLVTAPINKKSMELAGFKFKGHTDYLKHKFNVSNVLMLMVYENIRISVLTDHIPLKEVSKSISKDTIINALRLLHQTLIRDFGIIKPLIAVLGLNPHASDNGFIGTEEEEIIIPAIEEVRKEKIFALGPFPSDSFFGKQLYRNYDVILAMYHDQGLIPFKTLAFEMGVNYTAGLPIIRTSPDHGTAHDIVDKNLADPSSFRNAIYTAIDILKNRKKYDSLPKDKVERMPRETTIED
ncbi:MAG: 4-hydroxythreonine-4-phosphate dehydrogenase PdxA [Bacteroidales bacterium]|nr:4-hydroxythreonine-4-phosphate dehydrogenase PdxA [Bacteroidales bacterium]